MNDVWIQVWRQLDGEDLRNCSQVCKQWRYLLQKHYRIISFPSSVLYGAGKDSLLAWISYPRQTVRALTASIYTCPRRFRAVYSMLRLMIGGEEAKKILESIVEKYPHIKTRPAIKSLVMPVDPVRPSYIIITTN